MKFKFSIIIIINKSENFERSINSILKQSIGFEKNIQLIFVNNGVWNYPPEIINKYKKLHPDNIIVLSNVAEREINVKNLGLKYSEGEFINFLNCGDELSNNALNTVYTYFKKNNEINSVSIPIFLKNKQTGHYLNYKFKKNNSIIDLKENTDCPQDFIFSLFIRKNSIKKQFSTKLIHDENLIFINDFLLEDMKYGIVNNAKYFCNNQLDVSKVEFDFKSLKEKVNIVYKHLIDSSLERAGYVLEYIQFTILLDLKQIILYDNFEDIFENSNEFNEFINSLNMVLEYVDEKIILNHRFLDKNIKSFLIYLKNNDFHVVKKSKKVFLKSNDYLIEKLDNKIQIDLVDLKNNMLFISGFFKSICSSDFLSIEAIKVNSKGVEETFYPNYVEYFDRKNEKYLGIPWCFNYNFDFKIPMDEKSLSRVYLNIIYNEKDDYLKRQCKLNFGYFALLSELSGYFVKHSKIIYNFKNSIFIDNYSFKKICIREYNNLSKIYHSNKSKKNIVMLFRIIHLLLYPFLRKKRIWLFEDRLTVADDNAEFLFKYSIKQKDNIKKYFIINKDCDDFKRMSKVNKNIVAFGSLKHKLLYLFSEKIISSHVDHSVLNPFTKEYDLSLLNGLFTIERCFLQHGITKDNMSYWIKKYYVNLFLFLTSSDFEYNSIMDNEYNFEENVVQIFGFPRFDTLTNENVKKQVLFMPTWRSQVRERELFKNSDHFFRLKNFINNEKLITYLSENNFQLIFKPHFEIMEHIDLFDIPKEVKLASDESYQKLFNESSILITDFSSVAFDFAYLKKPVIYYQEKDDYHNFKSYFDYEKMGFGEVVKSEDELVNMIIDYINHDCKMKKKYLDRVTKFYKFTDKNNCRRIYNWLKENN